MSLNDPDHYAPEHEETDEVDTCPVCYGDGETEEEVCVGPDDWQLQTRRCKMCAGEGEIPADRDVPEVLQAARRGHPIWHLQGVTHPWAFVGSTHSVRVRRKAAEALVKRGLLRVTDKDPRYVIYEAVETMSNEDQIQMDLIEAYDAIQRRYKIDTDTMIIHLRAVLDREIAWAAEQEEEAEPHRWMECGYCGGRGCPMCGGEGYVYG